MIYQHVRLKHKRRAKLCSYGDSLKSLHISTKETDNSNVTGEVYAKRWPSEDDLNILFFFDKFRHGLLGKSSVIGHYPEGKRKIISLCYTRNMLFASHKSKIYYYKLIKTAGKCQKFV